MKKPIVAFTLIFIIAFSLMACNGVPDANEVPDASEMPRESEVAEESKATEESEMPEEGKAPEESEMPEESKVPEESKGPDANKVSNMSEGPLESGAPDYSQPSCWYKIPEITKDVDTFFVYPTEYLGANEGDPVYAPLDNPEMLEGVKNIDHKYMASVYEDSTNLFMPYYRQAGFRLEADAWRKTGDIRAALSGTPYDDITAALDYYFENYNEGRPFILAGHSQGSAICTLVLQNYFKDHPDYYDRMVAAYVIGFSVTKDELEANPHLKFATGESDTGVIVSWNVEGPKNVEENAPNAATLPNAISINPLNWKLDDTYAAASENLGSLVANEKTGETEIGDLGADAQVVPDRGVVVTNANYDPMEMTELFGPQSFHNGDYTFYYNNIRDNIAKRIAAYQSSAK